MVDQATVTCFNKIYEATFKKTVLYITKRCSADDIADVLQEVYTEVFSVLIKKGSKYVNNPEAFVLQVAKAKLYRHYTFRDKLRRFNPLVARGWDEEDCLEIGMADYSLEDVVVTKKLLEEIANYIAAKPDQVQKIFYMYYYLDLTTPAIAQELGMKESTVKSKLYRTVREVRKLYGRDGAHERKAIVSEGN